jgi:hypothetical protein
MNHCKKCQSDYEKPGTCNCFAPSRTAESADYWRGYAEGQRAARGSTWYPSYPWWQCAPTTVPYVQPSLTITCTEPYANTTWVKASDVSAPATFTTGYSQVVGGGGNC